MNSIDEEFENTAKEIMNAIKDDILNHIFSPQEKNMIPPDSNGSVGGFEYYHGDKEKIHRIYNFQFSWDKPIGITQTISKWIDIEFVLGALEKYQYADVSGAKKYQGIVREKILKAYKDHNLDDKPGPKKVRITSQDFPD